MNKCAFDVEKRCSALKEKCCEGCHFRKTNEELIKGREKAKERVDSLPKSLKEHILIKYYNQRRPRLIPKG